MLITPGRLLQSLDDSRSILPFRYGQWIAEDPRTFDFVVIVSRIPEESEGYAVAHRTGVIGQAFRTRRAIAVADTRAHPLYDPFDSDVDWEVAIPVMHGGMVGAVLNFEGNGALPPLGRHWRALRRLVQDETGGCIDEVPPDPTVPGTVRTQMVALDAPGLDVARTFASRGSSVLIIVADSSLADWLTVAEAVRNGISIAECFRGVGPRIDKLPLGVGIVDQSRFRSLIDGRYDIVLFPEAIVTPRQL